MLEVGTKVKLKNKVRVSGYENLYIEKGEIRTIVEVDESDEDLPYRLDGEVGNHLPFNTNGWVSADDISSS